jgi:hypothetical protein
VWTVALHATTSYTLPDIGLEFLDAACSRVLPASWAHANGGCINWPHGPDFFVHVHMLLFALLVLISPQRLKIVRRLFVVFAAVNAMRMITVIVTSLPDASPKCAAQWDDPALGG